MVGSKKPQISRHTEQEGDTHLIDVVDGRGSRSRRRPIVLTVLALAVISGIVVLSDHSDPQGSGLAPQAVDTEAESTSSTTTTTTTTTADSVADTTVDSIAPETSTKDTAVAPRASTPDVCASAKTVPNLIGMTTGEASGVLSAWRDTYRGCFGGDGMGRSARGDFAAYCTEDSSLYDRVVDQFPLAGVSISPNTVIYPVFMVGTDCATTTTVTG
jgi:hypothetical protein